MTVRNAASLRRDRMRSEQETHGSKAAPVLMPTPFERGGSGQLIRELASPPPVAVKARKRSTLPESFFHALRGV